MTSVLSTPRDTQMRVAISMAPVSPGFAGSGMISKSYCRASSIAKGSLVTSAQAGRRGQAASAATTSCSMACANSRARGLIEHGGEPLLGRRQILDWNEDHGRSEAVRAADLSRNRLFRDRLARNRLVRKQSAYRRRENASSQRGAVFGGAHDGLRALHPHACLAKRFGSADIASVANEEIEKIFVGLGHAGDGARQSLSGHENACRSGDGGVPHDRTYSSDFAAGIAQSLANSGDRKNGADAGDGITGGDEHGVGRDNGFDHSRRRFGVGGSGEAH